MAEIEDLTADMEKFKFYWRTLLILDKELVATQDFVEFSQANRNRCKFKVCYKRK